MSNKVDEKVYVFVVYELLFVNTVVAIGPARGPVLFASVRKSWSIREQRKERRVLSISIFAPKKLGQ